MNKDQQSSNRAKMKGVYQFCFKSGKYIGEHESIRAAERKTKTKGSDISACCKGKIKQAGGYIWVTIASYITKGLSDGDREESNR